MARSLFGSLFNIASQASKAAARERLQAQKQIERQRQIELREEHKHLAKMQGFVTVEFPRKKQILDESVRLIETTNNITVAKGRYETVMTHYKWMVEQKSKGMPVSFSEEACGFESSMKRAFNENIERLVGYNYNKDIAAIIKTKNLESRQKKIAKLRDAISQALSSLKVDENKPSIAANIKGYRSNLNDEIKELK